MLVMSEHKIDIETDIELMFTFSEFTDISFVTTVMSDNLIVLNFESELKKADLKPFFDKTFLNTVCKYYLLDYDEDTLAYTLDENDTKEYTFDVNGKEELDILLEVDGIWNLSNTKPAFKVVKMYSYKISEATADEILDKIKDNGIKSLTDSELNILNLRSKQL